MNNPCDFKTGDIIEDFYTKDHWLLLYARNWI